MNMDKSLDEKRVAYGKLTGKIGICCNILLAVSKLIVGLLSGMVSVVADAINNFSDAASSIISYIGFRLSEKPADDEHPFGHARYEYIAALVVAFLIMMAGVELLKTSVEKILHPNEITYSWGMYAVLLFSILVKLGMAVLNYTLGKKVNSTVIMATAADSRNDVLTTSAVVIAAFVSMKWGVNLDGIMGVVVAIFILVIGISLIRVTLEPLLGTAPDEETVKAIEEKVMSYEGVLGTHDLMVHDYGPNRRFASVHVEVPAERNVLECHELIDKIEQDFLLDNGLHMVIHYDPIVTSDEAVGSIRAYLKEQAKALSPSISIHDLRIVPGENNTNVIFDCVIPHSCPLSEASIERELSNRLVEHFPNHTAVIKIEHSFVSLS